VPANKFGIESDEFIEMGLKAMQDIAAELGL
jgi:predicted hydrolase (HD superfamily)